MKIDLIMESVSLKHINRINGEETVKVMKEALKDHGKILFETATRIMFEANASGEVDAGGKAGDNDQSKIKIYANKLKEYIKIAVNLAIAAINRFVDKIMMKSDMYIKFINKNKSKIEEGYKKLGSEAYISKKYTSLTPKKIIKTIEVRFHDVSKIRLDYESAYIDDTEISGENKKTIKELVFSIVDSADVVGEETKKVSDVDLNNAMNSLLNLKVVRDELNVHVKYLDNMKNKIDGNVTNATNKKQYMANIKFAAELLSSSISKLVNASVSKTITTFKFLMHCYRA